MNLLDILSPECIKVPLQATDKKGAIDELVDVLAARDLIGDPAALKEAVWARETTRTTGIGYSLAIPHGKCEGIPNLAMAMGKPAEPIDFASIDKKPVKLIVLLASPIDRTSDHIQALAQVSRVMKDEEFRERIYAAESAAEIYEMIQSAETAAAKG
ncbi:MAG: PTS sugar transporter subunit IIA [Phycisphaerales bacterium]|nr:PTS sugar transporter subunit IIA [Phycisphaerales bacterium]